MPLVFAPFVTAALGVLFAAFAKDELSRRERPAYFSHAFRIVVLHSAFVLLPVIGYFVTFHGDWGYLYLVASRHVPSALDLVFTLASAFAPCATFLSFARASAQDRTNVLFRALVVCILPLLGLSAFFFRRLQEVGTYEQFHGEFGLHRTSESSLGWAIALAWISLSLGVVAAWRAIRKQAAKV